MLEPASRKLGITVREDTTNGIQDVRAQITAGRVAWDVTEQELPACETLKRDGMLEPLDYGVIKTDGIPRELVNSHYVGWVDGKDVAQIEAAGGLIFSAEDVHRLGAAEVGRRALAHTLRGCEQVYLSLDIDALDAGFLPGTGSIVHSEITPRQYLDLLTALSTAPLCGVDLVEVSPPLDPSGRSERIAARLLMEVLREPRRCGAWAPSSGATSTSSGTCARSSRPWCR